MYAQYLMVITAESIGHINNLYNTTFWALIQLGGMDAKTAEKELAVSYALQRCIAGDD